MPLICATCECTIKRPPRLVAGAWYALCAECLYETEVEAIDPPLKMPADAAADFRVKGAAGLTSQQEDDLRRPRPAA